MRLILSFMAVLLLCVLVPQTYAAAQTQTFDTSAGPVKITPLNHASTLIEAGGKTIYLDPAKPVKFEGMPKADLILITDIHGDHMDPDSIKDVSKTDTEIISSPAVAQTVTVAKPLANGESKPGKGYPNKEGRPRWIGLTAATSGLPFVVVVAAKQVRHHF